MVERPSNFRAGHTYALDDSKGSPYSHVFGEQPLLPPIADQTSSLEEFKKALQRLQCLYHIPRSRTVGQKIHNKLSSSTHVCLGLDRVKNPLEAPYQRPYKVFQFRGQTFTLEICT